jgi:hypothetical protein
MHVQGPDRRNDMTLFDLARGNVLPLSPSLDRATYSSGVSRGVGKSRTVIAEL